MPSFVGAVKTVVVFLRSRALQLFMWVAWNEIDGDLGLGETLFTFGGDIQVYFVYVQALILPKNHVRSAQGYLMRGCVFVRLRQSKPVSVQVASGFLLCDILSNMFYQIPPS